MKTPRNPRCHVCGKHVMPPPKTKTYHEEMNELYLVYLCNDCDKKIDWR